MANYMTEDDLMRELEIEDWGHMTKDKIMQFASNLHKLSPEVAKKILEQLPEFTTFATNMINHYKDIVMHVLNSNEKGAQAYYDMCNSIIEGMKVMLKCEDMTYEQKQNVISQMIQLSNNVADMQREERVEKRKILKICGTVIITVVGIIGAIIGGGSGRGNDKDA